MDRLYKLTTLVFLMFFGLSLQAQKAGDVVAPVEIRLNNCLIKDFLFTDFPDYIGYVDIIMKPVYYPSDDLKSHRIFWRIELYDALMGKLKLEYEYDKPAAVVKEKDAVLLAACDESSDFQFVFDINEPKVIYIQVFGIGDEVIKQFVVAFDDAKWIDYFINWAYYTVYAMDVSNEKFIKKYNVTNPRMRDAWRNGETRKKMIQIQQYLIDNYPKGYSGLRDNTIPTLEQLDKRMKANFGISNYFDPVTDAELSGKTNMPTQPKQTTEAQSTQPTQPKEYAPTISQAKKNALRFNESTQADCDIVELLKYPFGMREINYKEVTKKEFKAALKKHYPRLDPAEERGNHFDFWKDKCPLNIAFHGKAMEEYSVCFYNGKLMYFTSYFNFKSDEYTKEDVLAFTEIICDELKKAGASLERYEEEKVVVGYRGNLEGGTIYVSMRENDDNYGVHTNTFPNYPTKANAPKYASPSSSTSSTSSSSSSSTSSYTSKYSRWPHYYSNPVFGLHFGYAQRTLRDQGFNDERVTVFGEKGGMSGFQAGFFFHLFKKSLVGMSLGLNYEMFFSSGITADNYYRKYEEINLYAPIDVTFHLPFSRTSAVYLHAGLGMDISCYNRFTYPFETNVYGRDALNRFNLSYEYGVDWRIKGVMLHANFQKGITTHYPFGFSHPTKLNKISVGMSFVF